MGIENITTFMITTLFFIMTPGIDTFFVLHKSIGQGRKSGVYAALGINAGVLVHTLFAALGLSVLISESVLVFTIVKFLGAGYLIYMGFLNLKSTKEFIPTEAVMVKGNTRNDFWSGFLTNSLNPKVALFFLAFFPQFVQASELDNPIPFLFLGITYALIGVVWYLILSLFASAFTEKLKGNPKSGVLLNKLRGSVFIVMGVKLALTKS